MTAIESDRPLRQRGARGEIAPNMDSASSSAIAYTRRETALSRGEREWRAEPDALVTCARAGRERRFKWADIVGVRLRCAPTRAKPFRHLFELHSKHGQRIEIDNAHCLGPRRFEDRTEAYAPFVRAALRRIAAANPKARALIGETPKRYFFLVFTALVVLSVGAVALITLPTPLDGMRFAPLLKFGLILVMLPVFFRWVMGAMPKGVALDAIPERALPPTRDCG